jgi:anti-sigma factor RsiW
MSGDSHHRSCDPEAIFELADGALGPEREHEARAHLAACPACRRLYEEELRLNSTLCSLRSAEPPCRSVRRGVAMALPTRPWKARLVWVAVSLALLISASLALSLDGATPATLAVNAVGFVWGLVSGFADVARTVLSATGPTLAVALAIGALADLCIAAAVILATRRSLRQA